jgi:hypothetical protein
MINLGFRMPRSAELILWIFYSIIGILHISLMLLILFAIESLKMKSAMMKFEMILSFIVTNTYSALFFAAFCVFIYSIYNRFELINDCIRFSNVAKIQ